MHLEKHSDDLPRKESPLNHFLIDQRPFLKEIIGLEKIPMRVIRESALADWSNIYLA